MATLHLMVGLPCSGKTARARELETECGALRLTPDEWHLRLFGDDAEAPEHDARHGAIEAIMWQVAARALALGTSVILDFGFWAREEREDFRARAAALGAGFRIHYMEVPTEELYRRLAVRNERAGSGAAFTIPRALMDRYLPIFQPPEPEELE